ncbi:hypothetical protein [Actinomadura roseirufa]|uniref:hypothetical protein n=1 Tax=Actinomadura roseirufa TaxID=2094049 RepID=UPI0010411A26|nr:hypothetical protein [Actinomadura roseirufa]
MMVTQKYLDACADEHGGMRHVMAAAPLPEVFAGAWGGYLLPRPLFAPGDEFRRATADVIDLFTLLRTLPDRLFGGDRRAFCAAIGADEQRTAVMTAAAHEPILYGRADLYQSEDGYRLLELNSGSELGGVDISEVNRALLDTEPFGAFAKEHDLSHVDTPAAIARHFIEATQKENPVVADLEAIGAMPVYLGLHRAFQETMKRYGVEILLGEADQVQYRDGRPYLQDRPIDLVVRYFSVNQMVKDPRNVEHVQALERAHEEGKVVLWTPLSNSMFSYKSCLALVSDPDVRADLSAEENALIDRILPWTRILTPDLVDQVRAEREHMILKPFANLAGQGIHVGWDQTDREWAENLAACDGRTHIVQRRVVPVTEPVMDPATGTVHDYRAVWGPFLFSDGYGGAFCRTVPVGGTSVVTLNSIKGRSTSAFLY